jgi:hypothetical protein
MGSRLTISAANRAEFEKLGYARVRLKTTTYGFGTLQEDALAWLAEFEEAERERNEASHVEQASAASRAAAAAERAAIAAEAQALEARRANTRATIALAIAIIGIAITFISWLFPRH